jgi:choline dehydrogenase-like flavoprotein
MWARETQRWSRFEFEAPGRDGYAVEWPITYDDLAPWYSHVEKFAGISGNKDGIENLPDGEFLPPWEFNCAEKMMRDKVNAHYKDRVMLMGRCANLTKAGELQLQQGAVNARHVTSAIVVVLSAHISVPMRLLFPGRKKQAILLYNLILLCILLFMMNKNKKRRVYG